tara:strand:- start:7017 stop:7214 length:198 start_codon:yes stop_codon:yes gene_type:complete
MNTRYKASEAKNTGDNLTHSNSNLHSSHGAAFQAVSNINSDNEMIKASADVDSMDYFNELLKDCH